jgi:uncharacterized protein (DUF58 family)
VNSLRTFWSIRKRVRQRATIFSLLVVVLLVGLFLEAYMHNFNLVYITLFFVFAAAFAAGPMGVRNLGSLEAEFAGCDRIFANREGVCRFQVHNPASLSAWAVELHSALGSTSLPELPPHTRKRVTLPLTPQKRGRIDAGPCFLQSLFPLATVRFVLEMEAACNLVVYPEPKGEPLRSYLLRRRAPFGDEMDFDGLARYSGAESLSRIHWPSVAKGEVAVKTFEHETSSDTLQFEFYRCGNDDETRLSQLTLWTVECEQNRQPFTIVMPHNVLDSRKESIDAILEHLAFY